MYWGWGKQSKLFIFEKAALRALPEYCAQSNTKFMTVKALVPKILDSAGPTLFHKFFRKSWHYIDAYQYV